MRKHLSGDAAVAQLGSDLAAVASSYGFTATELPAGRAPTGVAVGDLNGDGLPDLAVANFVAPGVSLLLGAGGGAFEPAGVVSDVSGSRTAAIGDFNFLYFSGVLFLICVVAIIVASLSDAAPDQTRIRGLTFRTLDRQAVRASWSAADIVLTTVVLGLVALLYVYFSFWIG